MTYTGNNRLRNTLYTLLLLTMLLLTGCANAGKDQKVEAGETVTLDGSQSKADLFGEVTKYKWKQVKLKGHSELKVELADKNTATPTFTAPSVEKKTSLHFRLVATETGGIISPFTTKDTVKIEVSPTTSTNKSPKAKATANPKKVLEGEVVLFDGSASSDDDGTIVSYAWSDEDGTVLSTEQSFSHSFETKGKHTITLKVTDEEGASDSTTVRIKVKEAPKPKVSILVDQVQTSEKTVVQGTTLAFTAMLLEEDEHKDKTHHKKEHKKHKKHHDDTPVYTWKDAQGNILSHEISFSQTFITVGSHVITLEVIESHHGHGSKDMHTASVTIIVIDVTPPVLTLNGEANITLVQNAVYTELGATALDAVDGNVSVAISGTVNTAVVGIYTLTYTAQDSAGNEANITRSIIVIDVTPPVITLNGVATITLEQNAVYTELGATALDAVDGNVSVSISGTVDTSTVGNYTVIYMATDSAGNEANTTRTINIIDVTPPVITLNGEANITLEQNTAYTELGATALDAVDGNVSVNISGTVDTGTIGNYTIIYTAQDNSGNEANTTRTITIIDVTPPVITLNGQSTVTLEQNAVYNELGATALDAVDGNVSVNISGTVDTSTVGDYVVTYSAQDTSGNEANTTRTITVIDVTPPAITLNGQSNITLVQNAVYTELGATALDAVDGNVSVAISGTVNTAVVGTYTLTYSAQDNAGNEANITRSITIIDVTPPVITLNGQSNITLEHNAVYTELGATALDGVDGNVTVTTTGTVDTATVGSYTVTYSATDSAGNEANITRAITVIDVTPPVITLNGQSTITLEQNAVYTELGATALDAVDGNVSVTISGTVDTATVGSYTVTYTAQDQAGNEANVTRTITVIDVTPPVITLNGESNITLEQNVIYTELGATAVDGLDGNVSVTTTGTVDTSTIGNYTITYSATDSAGNEGTLQRYINVTSKQVEDMGYLVESNDTEAGGKPSIVQLSVNLLYDKNLTFDLKQLQVCNDKRCWGVIDSITNVDVNNNIKKSTLIANEIRVVNLGFFDIYDMDQNFTNIDEANEFRKMISKKSIDSIKFIYNGKKGEAKFPRKMSFSWLGNSLYVKLDEKVTVPFNDRYNNYFKNELYVPSVAYRHKFDNGVILDIPKDALNQMAFFRIEGQEGWEKEKEYFEFYDYSISFYGERADMTYDEVMEALERGYAPSTVPKHFSKNIGVYLPLKKSSITKEELLKEFKFSNGNNQGYTEDFEIVTIEGKKYVYFETNLTTFNPGFDSK